MDPGKLCKEASIAEAVLGGRLDVDRLEELLPASSCAVGGHNVDDAPIAGGGGKEGDDETRQGERSRSGNSGSVTEVAFAVAARSPASQCLRTL